MNVYVLGAAVSETAGYPLGGKLFDEIDGFVRNSSWGPSRSEYDHTWTEMCDWLESKSDPLIVEAYRKRLVEHLFTILDLASELSLDAFAGVARAVVNKEAPEKRGQAEAAHRNFEPKAAPYKEYRRVLLSALQDYFLFKHREDYEADRICEWDRLGLFAQKLLPRDVIITFNYDSTVERVLWHQGKWSPCDGYGFSQTLTFQGQRKDQKSAVTVLHLHGSIGWYPPSISPDNPYVSIDPIFLKQLGVDALDASLTESPAGQRQMLLHPSFLKDYEQQGSDTRVFIYLWRRAAEALRAADKIYVIGYSLPAADSAALTLLSTNCDPGRVEIVNRHPSRLLRLLTAHPLPEIHPPVSFQEWVEPMADACSLSVDAYPVGLTLHNVMLNLLYYGVVVVVVPWCLLSLEGVLGLSRPPSPIVRIASIFLGLLGAALQLWCILVFQREGKGTPSPLFPPAQFVTQGPYRFVRNPMNIGEVILLLAVAGWFGSLILLAYALFAGIAFHSFVILFEEPRHIERFGDDYVRYKARVNRWVPKLKGLSSFCPRVPQ